MFSSWSRRKLTFIFLQTGILGFSVSTTELAQLGPVFPRTSGTNNSSIPVEALMTPLPKAYSFRPQKCTAHKRIWYQAWMGSLPGSSDTPIKRMSQPSPTPDECTAGSHLIASCLNFLPFIFKFYFFSTSCHVFSACKREDAICIHNLQGDFYWTVRVTLSDIILTVLALGWYSKLKLIMQDAVWLSLALGKASP